MVSSRWKCRTGVTELSGSDWMARWSSSTLASGDNSGSEQGGTAGETHWSRLEGTLTWESLHDYGRTAAIPEGHENVDRALELAPCIEVGHQPLWPSPSSISACAVFSASSGPPVEASPTRTPTSSCFGARWVFSSATPRTSAVSARRSFGPRGTQPRSTEMPLLDRRGCRFGLAGDVWGANTRIADQTG